MPLSLLRRRTQVGCCLQTVRLSLDSDCHSSLTSRILECKVLSDAGCSDRDVLPSTLVSKCPNGFDHWKWGGCSDLLGTSEARYATSRTTR